MRKLFLLLVVIASVGMAGCGASIYPFAFDSNPQGATVICDGQNLGYTPTTVYYDRGKMKNPNLPLNYPPFDTRRCSANWASGAKASYTSYVTSREKFMAAFPNGVSATVQRPKVPGLAQDNQFALQVQQMLMQQAAMQQQAAAMQQAAFMQQMGLMQAQTMQQSLLNQNQLNSMRVQPSNTNVNVFNTGGRPTWIPVQ